MSHTSTHRTIGYLLKTFPKVSETFILQEILDLEALGLDLAIYALQRPTDTVAHGLAGQARASVTYLSRSPFAIRRSPLWAHIRLSIVSPQRYLSTVRFWLRASERPSLSEFLQAGSLGAALLDAKIDHLHVHFANEPASVAELAHRLTGIPYSMTCHAKDIFLATPSILQRKMRHAEFVVTCTEANRQHLQRLSDNSTPISRLYHGLNLARFDTLRVNHGVMRSTIPTIISVGRFREKKGFLTLIRACHLLAVRGHRFRCCIVGYGPLQADMEALIRELNLEDIITLAGKKTLEEVVALYQEADIFTLPCQVAQDGDRDGIPNVLMEAMGGYNTVVEILTANQRAIIIPRVHPRVEQHIRAERLAAKGLIDMIHPAELNPDGLFDAINHSLQRPRPSRPQDMGIELNGAINVSNAIEQLHRSGVKKRLPSSLKALVQHLHPGRIMNQGVAHGTESTNVRPMRKELSPVLDAKSTL